MSAHNPKAEEAASGTPRPDSANALAAAALADDARWGFIDPHGAKADAIRKEAARDD